jgi:hypothetical protein
MTSVEAQAYGPEETRAAVEESALLIDRLAAVGFAAEAANRGFRGGGGCLLGGLGVLGEPFQVDRGAGLALKP